MKDGADIFNRDVYITDQHEKYLSQDYFPVVAQMRRNPRYTNKRIMDPQIKCFVDEAGIEIPPEWSLPVPNADAAYLSLAKYGKDILPMTEEMVSDMNLAWKYTQRHFGLYMQESKVLSYSEAKQHLDMSTSSGAPFNSLYPVKADLFEKDPTIDDWLQEDWELMGSDPNWTCLFTNSLKEEMRTAEKISANSMRTFLAGGVDAVVHGTRLFVDMNEKMYSSHLKTSSAVGLSPYKGNWNRLYEKLKVFKKGFALDETQYDSSLRTFLMWGCAQLRWQMLKPEFRTPQNRLRIVTYYRNLVNTVVVCPDGVLVFKKTGNPSGSVNTITDNTLVLYTLLAYAWIRTSTDELHTYENFELHTAKALVGDDNTWTVSDEAFRFYNAKSVIEQWKCVGITTTTDSLEPRHPSELDFLSAHTVFLDGVAVPIYSRVKLMNSLLYAPRVHLTPATTLERTAAMLSVGWTDLPFRRFCRDLIAWLLEKYDEILYDEPRWMLAKCQVQGDEHYYSLFTGKNMFLKPQSMSGARVKLIQPDKSTMNSARPKRNGTKPGKKTNQGRKRRATRRPRGQATRPANVGKVKKVTIRAPRQRFLPNGNLLVSHREFIAKVPGSVNFSVTSDPINPGLPVQFKWLYPIANQYESYRIRKLSYEFVNSKAGTFAGDVIMGIDYDPLDATPFNEEELQTYWGARTGQICEPLTLHADIKALHKLGPDKFVRMGTLSANRDLKTYDSGTFFIATTDCADTSTIGRLFVNYEIEFQTPNGVSGNVLSEQIAVVGETAAALCGTSFVQTGLLSSTWLSSNTFSIDVPGQYQIIFSAVGTGITAAITASIAAPSVSTSGSSVINGAATAALSAVIVKVANATDVITLAVTATTITAVVMSIAPYTYSNGAI